MSEIFSHFEVNRDSHWRLLLGLIGGSILLHLGLIACVVFVPTVRDSLNIVALVAGSSYVDRPYAKTVFGEDIQMVEAAPKFHYPPGYFAEGLPQASPSPTVDPNAPKIIYQAKPPKPESSPSPSPSPSIVASPSPVVAQEKGPSARPDGGNKTGASSGDQKPGEQKTTTADQDKKDEVQKQLEKTAADNNVALPRDNEINRQPIKDLAAYANNLKNEGKLDLEKSFEVQLEAELDGEGKLHDPTVTQKSGDPNLSSLATSAIAAINDSGLLIYLKKVNEGHPTKITIVISQDGNSLLAKLETELGSEQSARQQAGAFSIIMKLAQKTREGKDEEALLKRTTAVSEGKKLVFQFSMPRQDAVDMIKKQLASGSTKQGS
jgi:hypothetical protein